MTLKAHLIVCVLVCVLFLIATAGGWHLPESSGGGYGGGRGYGGSWGGGK